MIFSFPKRLSTAVSYTRVLLYNRECLNAWDNTLGTGSEHSCSWMADPSTLKKRVGSAVSNQMMKDAFAGHVPVPIGGNAKILSTSADGDNTFGDPFHTDVCRKHREFVKSTVVSEDKMECHSCVLFKLSYNEDSSSWIWDTWTAAVSL